MSSSRPHFTDIVTVLHSGKPVAAATPSQPTPKAGRGKGDAGARAPVYAAIMEGESTADGRLRIGLAATNPATMEFHLFSITDSVGLSTLKALLRALDPTDIIINAGSTSAALHDAVRAVCRLADIGMAKQTLYEGGLNTYARLTAVRAKLNVRNAAEGELCLGVFTALVKFAEHQRDSRYPRSSLTVAFRGDPGLLECPLCEADENAEQAVMGSVKEIQEHFFQEHWQLHGYACHLCGEVYQTVDQLVAQHTECDAWTRWRTAWKGSDGELKMTHGRMLLCCADCGWHTVLEQRKGEEKDKIGYLKNFFAHHNNDGLLVMMVYFPARPDPDLTTMRLSMHSTAGGDPTARCMHCLNAAPFKDPTDANEHCMKFHRDKPIECGVEACRARATTDYLMELHQMSHVSHDNSFLADFLSNSAKIHPPPNNLSYAPRCGWKDRAKTKDFAFGGVMERGGGETRKKKGYDLVGPLEDVRQAKARLIKSRGRNDKGYENASFPQVSRMAKRVMEDLRKKYSHVECIASFDEHTWLTDEAAQRFADWMAGWESEEGQRQGGPPKQLVVDLPPSAIVRIPSVEVTLQLRDTDTLSGYLLNANLFYCFGCDSILKGNQAFKHLKPNRDQTANKCAMQVNGRIQPNPIKNSNMFQLYSHAAAPPDYTLPCPHCDRKSCSITGLRVHIMCAHGTFVKCKREDSEVMPDALSLKFNLRSKLNRDRQTAARLEKDMKALNLQKKQGRKAALPVPLLREEGSDDGIEVLGQRLVRSKKRKAEDDDAVWMTVQAMVNRVVRKEYQLKGEEEPVEEKPVFVLSDDECIISDHDSDVVVMEEADARRNLSATIREESEAFSAGGKDEPGYREDEEEDMMVDEAMDVQPLIRQFTPDDEDDELCVVAEVEDAGVVGRAATIESQREKKLACGKCSDRFRTQASLQQHLRSAHQFDAGETTITEELGCPTNTAIWLCKLCCLAFQSMDQKRAHSTQHGGQRMFGCETCSCVAYNGEVMAQHQRKLADKRITYICGECRFEFEHEMQLHEHSRDKHAAVLLYFCKACEVASTDGPYIYGHIVENTCPQDFQRRPKSQEEAAARIGVCPANQMHFQPTTMTDYKETFARMPNKFVAPSLCSHRSLIVANDKQISCKECRCLENLQRHVAMISHEDDAIRKYEASITKVRTHPPLTTVRLEYEKRQRAEETARAQRHHANQMARRGMASGSRGGRVVMHPGAMRYGGGGAPPQSMQHMAYAMQVQPQLQHVFTVDNGMGTQQERAEAARRFNDRVQAAQSAKMSIVGRGGGRPPMLTPGSGTRAPAHIGGSVRSVVGSGGRPPMLTPGTRRPAILRPALSGPRPQPQRVHAPYAFAPHTPPVLTRAPLSTMGSLQSIAAMVGASVGPQPGYGSHAAPVGGTCTHCDAQILSQRDSFIHSLHTSDRGAFVCAACPVAIADERSAIKHIVNHMEPRERQLEMDMKCPFEECGVEVHTLIMLKNHLIAHAPPLRHRVSSCHLAFGSAALAQTHEEIHEKSLSDNECCILCGTMDNWEMEMTDRRGKGLTVQHVMKHAMPHKYYCKLCDMQAFDQESQMVTHYIMLHTAAEGDLRTCSDCDERLRTEQDHKVHCLAQHTITELYQPEKMTIRIPQEFSDHIGVGIDEPAGDDL